MTMPAFGFRTLATDGAARVGIVDTAHGPIDTPAFMPVGTAGTVKAMTADAVRATGAQMVLGNTYHLMLRPGADLVASLGGLHRMMDWPGPILTDSGGFQVMSLAALRRIDAEGVTFRSPPRWLDASPDPGAGDADPARPRRDRHHGARRVHAVPRYRGPGARLDGALHALGGGVAGGVRAAPRLRAVRHRPGRRVSRIARRLRRRRWARSASTATAIGGLAVGEGQAAMFAVLEATVPLLPADRPRYLMGVGTPDDILGAVARGIDLFDCVIPTRAGRTARAYTSPRGVQPAQRPLRR